MKRLFLAIGLAAFLMTSCCDGQGNKENKKDAKCEGNCKDKKEQCDHHHGPKCHEMTAEDRAEIEGIIDAFKGWDNLDEAQKTAALATAKARVEKCMAKKAEMGQKCEGNHEGCKHEGQKCEGNHEGCKHEGQKCEGKHEGCNHEGQKCEGKMTKEECDAKWAAFETLTLDEQKAVLCCKLRHCPGFKMVMHEKCAPKHEGCKHEAAPKCGGNHEGCRQQCEER
ncbi:MAG: hypothetical protein KBT67_11230 [bacterium]|nr:hypothetical protein [Candidatus Limimorpha caballi]